MSITVELVDQDGAVVTNPHTLHDHDLALTTADGFLTITNTGKFFLQANGPSQGPYRIWVGDLISGPCSLRGPLRHLDPIVYEPGTLQITVVAP